MSLLVAVSAGELLDKLTILRIKKERIIDVKKLKNIVTELDQLKVVVTQKLPMSKELDVLVQQLQEVNERLWEIEDEIRSLECKKEFGEQFVRLARSVYRTNDQRAELKYRINVLLDSELVEEKSYQSY